MNGARRASVLAVIFLSACATGRFNPEPFDYDSLRTHAVTQVAGDLRVTASVPGQLETQAIFGADLYKRGIQPVWVEIENNSPKRVRFAPVGMDRDYFSPLEVTYVHKRGFSKLARAEMEAFYYKQAMPRQIPAGTIRSGFVFTNADPGTKSFNIDLFGNGVDHSMAFFVDVPGFVPDHAEVEFKNLYTDSELSVLDADGVRKVLSQMPCCTTDLSGDQSGYPVNIAFIGTGSELLRALLRANWHETSAREAPNTAEALQHLFGRRADAIFRIQRDKKRNRNVMSLWLSPYQLDGKSIWLAQITHFIGQDTQIEEIIFGARVDPDVDDTRNYILQNLWYAQSLAQVGWINTPHGVPIDVETTAKPEDKRGFFTDGVRVALWVSGVPISLTEVQRANWDDPPPR